MRAPLAPAALAVALAFAPSAFAAAPAVQNTTGAIKAFNMKTHMITLDDGSSYRLPRAFKNPGLKVGQKVQVSWQTVKGQHDATKVTTVAD